MHPSTPYTTGLEAQEVWRLAPGVVKMFGVTLIQATRNLSAMGLGKPKKRDKGKMGRQPFKNRPAHWVLSEVGKSVLRPGGQELTHALVDELTVSAEDDVIEFAPGRGATAKHVLDRDPNSYIGVERDRKAAAALADEITGSDREIRVGTAGDTELGSTSADVVYGEAMLTMQPDDGKTQIISEANRLLRSGGVYGIHELGLRSDDLDDETTSRIHEDLSQVLNVNAGPLSGTEWVELLDSAGFDEIWRGQAPMKLLDPRRVISDEGLLGALRIGFNVATTPAARNRIQEMRRIFNRYDQQLHAIAIVARKR
jgi:hypothetical protein